ncbi:hypothetical protein [Helicobacter canis]|uniref:Uncharacterized protein n=1 Tax=Helicobacter canis NCTC 12740 TaxID=1357399 RepID=V8CJQ7_9HELI|nr:hypothetical protein [Helicobacter canis]ETD27579.1 hypothetical protein HMPREF2087_00497 [Helicobacter canis NCTC 12740]
MYKRLDIQSNIKTYQVYFCENTDFIVELAKLDNVLFMVDSKVYELYKNNVLLALVDKPLILLEIDENHKSLDYVATLYEKIMHFAPKKNIHLISIGGGITQDITGFIASSLYRGVKWSFIPTTLLAQTDSCIGAKTSLNFASYKNLIGTFFPPDSIYIYAPFIDTLDRVDTYSGIGEMAKFHLLCGRDKAREFAEILPKLTRDEKTLLETISFCLQVKQGYIEEDEFDTGRRNLLNYGHCFGHALESSTNFALPHGLAVVVGMLSANRVARKRDLLTQEEEAYIASNVLCPLLVCDIPRLDVESTLQAMAKDKKNTASDNRLPLIMLANRQSVTSSPPPPVVCVMSMYLARLMMWKCRWHKKCW